MYIYMLNTVSIILLNHRDMNKHVVNLTKFSPFVTIALWWVPSTPGVHVAEAPAHPWGTRGNKNAGGVQPIQIWRYIEILSKQYIHIYTHMVDVNHESLRSPKTKTQHGRVPVSLGPLSGGRCVFKKCFSRLKTSKQLTLLMLRPPRLTWRDRRSGSLPDGQSWSFEGERSWWIYI